MRSGKSEESIVSFHKRIIKNSKYIKIEEVMCLTYFLSFSFLSNSNSNFYFICMFICLCLSQTLCVPLKTERRKLQAQRQLFKCHLCESIEIECVFRCIITMLRSLDSNASIVMWATSRGECSNVRMFHRFAFYACARAHSFAARFFRLRSCFSLSLFFFFHSLHVSIRKCRKIFVFIARAHFIFNALT